MKRRERAIVLGVVILLGISTTLAHADTTYTVIDLGDLPGGSDYSHATGINVNGQVVGISNASTGERAFLWDSGVMTNLGDLPGGGDYSYARGINASGQAVGYSSAATGMRAFLWDSGVMTDLGDLPGGADDSQALGINAGGQVVGTGAATTGGRAFLWTPVVPNGITGSMIDLGELPGGADESQALGINASGQVVGLSQAATGWRAFLWEDLNANGQSDVGEMLDLGDLPDGPDLSIAQAINASSQVVGVSEAATGSRAFLWDAVNGMQNLGDLPGGGDYSYALGINASGQVVGRSDAASGRRAVLWDSVHDMVDLNTLLDASGTGWTLQEAWNINDKGWIVGAGTNPDGFAHGFLLVPEPGTLSLLLLGGIVTLKRRR